MSRVLTGKWRWNDVIETWDNMDVSVQFGNGSVATSNGEKIISINFYHDGEAWKLEYDTGTKIITAGAGYALPFEQYRIIDFGDGCEVDDDADGAIVRYWFLPNITRDGTIAEKMEQIAENEQKVYQSGYDRALEKGGYSEGYEDGKQAEYDAFWEAYQPDTAVTPYQFSSKAWNDNNFFPKRDMIAEGNIYGAFYGIGVTDLVKRLNECGVKIDTSKATNLGTLFQYAYTTTIPKISAMGASQVTSVFSDCTVLKTIECLEVHAAITYYNTFYCCQALENITFEGVIGNDINFQWSTLLTKASITNIIEHLSLDAREKTLTLSKAAVDREFEGVSGEDFTTIVEGSIAAEWLILITTRINWNIKFA